jgi:hypothetical protein
MFTSLFIVTMMNPNRRLHRTITRPLCKLFDRSTAFNTSGISISHTTLLRYDKQPCQTRRLQQQQSINIRRIYRYGKHFSDNKTKSSFELQPHGALKQMQ